MRSVIGALLLGLGWVLQGYLKLRDLGWRFDLADGGRFKPPD